MKLIIIFKIGIPLTFNGLNIIKKTILNLHPSEYGGKLFRRKYSHH